jgi:hypothetical protein
VWNFRPAIPLRMHSTTPGSEIDARVTKTVARLVGIGVVALVVLGACSTVRPAPLKREKPAPSVSAEPASRAGAAITDLAQLSNVPPSCRDRVATIDRKRPLAPPIANSSQLLMAPDFDGDYGFYAVSGSVPPPSTADGGALELDLTGPVKRSPVQELELRLTFHNRSPQPLTVVRPLDGTLEHMRDPGYDLYLRDESNGKLYRWAFVGGRCGNVNAIDKSDYVSIPAGARRSKVADNGWASHLRTAGIGRPGAYTLWVVYRFCSFKPRGVPLGSDLVETSAVRGVYASNALGVVVR